MSQSENDHDRRVREFWSKAYDNLFKDEDTNNDSGKLPYKPTAVLASQRNSSRKTSIYAKGTHIRDP